MSTNWYNVFANDCPLTQQYQTVVPSFLMPSIQLGQFGSINKDLNFTPFGTISNMSAINQQPYGQLVLSGEADYESTGDVTLQGEVIDPDSGTEVKASLQINWSFNEDTIISGKLGSVFNSSFQDADQTLLDNYEQIVLVAKENGYVNRDGTLMYDWILITEIYQIIAGVIVGSTTKGTTYSIAGTINAMNALADGGVNAGFGLTTQDDTGSFFTLTFPSGPVALNPNGKGIDPNTISSANTYYTLAFSGITLSSINSTVTAWQR